MERRKQIEGYIFASLFIIPILVFILTPSHITDNADYQLNSFLDQYLFGNGWYSPSNYPFAAKVTNNLSVILAIVTGLFIGIWRRNDIVVPVLPKNSRWIILVVLGVGVLMILKSFYPQEFKAYSGRRSSFFTEAFHNNPIFFLAMIIVKEVCIYLPFRMISFLIYLFKGKK